MVARKHKGLAGGELTIDPTENVKALTEAANKRQDDLRTETDRRVSGEIESIRRELKLRAAFAKEIRDLESRRLDAIRQVDVTAVKTEADRALAAIGVLATTTATNAENLRNALNNTATTIANQTAATVQQITERIAALEKSSYEGSGKGTGAKNLWGILAAVTFLIFGLVTTVVAVIAFVVSRTN